MSRHTSRPASDLNQRLDLINNLRNNHLPNAGNTIKKKIDKMPAILTDVQLKNLDNHKYSSEGSTLLDPLFQPYWRWLVEQIPMTVAPNLLTIIGLILNVVTSTLFMIYSPNGDQEVKKFFLSFFI